MAAFRSSASLLLPSLTLLAAVLAAAEPSLVARHGGCYSRLFSFGDSIIDNGNWLHYAPVPGPVAMLPYGETFFHHPTGRFSNGRLIIDYIAKALEIPFLTPYLAGNLSEDFRHGANFAVGGATALNQDYFRRKNLTVLFTPYCLGTQVRWFHKLLQMLTSSHQSGCMDIMENSLFLVGEIGGNDYNQPLIQNRSIEEIRTYVPDVINAIAASLIDLIKLGAKTLVVPGNFPLGCVPAFLTLFRTNDTTQYDTTGCLKWLNDFAEYHNNTLKVKLEQLRQHYPDITLIYADYYGATMSFTTNPHKYGFDDKPLVACCGAGGPSNVNFLVNCGVNGSTACVNPYKSVSWDGLHLTEHAYEIITDDILEGPYAVPPVLSKCKHSPI